MSIFTKKKKRAPRHLQYENLESREMMAVTGKLSKTGVLTISGSKYADSTSICEAAGNIVVAGAGVWATSRVNSIKFDLGKGNDYVSLDSIANGGWTQISKNVVVATTTAGLDTVHLANGHNVTLNGKTHNLSVSAGGGVTRLDGNVLTWNTPTPPTPSPPSPPSPPPAPSPSNTWFDSHVLDAALRTLGNSLYTDGIIDRNDMISLLRNAEDGGSVDATELTDLRAITTNTTLFGSFDYVWKLSSYVVTANAANATYQGSALGNLSAGSSAAQMENLVNKWFLGLDRPTAGGAYRQIAGTLFVGGAAYTDIRQGYLGDCYFMTALAETALKNQSAITSMFTVNGDGTYTVRFYNAGQAQYVTVDSYLPTDSAGRLIYAGIGAAYTNSGNELWTALAEKAYVQINQMGWVRPGLPGNGQNAYSAIEGGYIYAGLGHVTGQATVAFASTLSTSGFSTFVTAYNAGKSIGFASKTTPASSAVVGSHAYTVVSYNSANQTVTLFNPWGTSYAQVTMTWAEIQGSFSYFDRTA